MAIAVAEKVRAIWDWGHHHERVVASGIVLLFAAVALPVARSDFVMRQNIARECLSLTGRILDATSNWRPVGDLPGVHPTRLDRSSGQAAEALERATARIVDALDEGRAFARQHDTLVEAHFALGTNEWTVRAGFQDLDAGPWPDVPRLFLHAAAGLTGGDQTTWQFLDVQSLDGRPVGPTFVFWPDGHMQGGEVRFGWSELSTTIRVDANGTISVHRDSH